MYAVLETGGKQFQVQVGDQIKVEKIASEVGESIALDKVLMLGGDDSRWANPISKAPV